jgi:hypothetical protein
MHKTHGAIGERAIRSVIDSSGVAAEHAGRVRFRIDFPVVRLAKITTRQLKSGLPTLSRLKACGNESWRAM